MNGTKEFYGLVGSVAAHNDFRFDAPIIGFAGDWNGTTDGSILHVDVNGTTIKFSDHLSSPGNGFLGVVDTAAFSSIFLSAPGEDVEKFSVDNCRIASVPEPPAMLLLGSGLVGFLAFRRMLKRG